MNECVELDGCCLKHSSCFKVDGGPCPGWPCPQSLGARIKALPEQAANKSRNYGRGYAQAIRDVLALIEKDNE